jgi:GNAT superfamily N-acetyltransferase
MSELDRALAFEEALRERCAERIVPFRFGRALFNDTYRIVWELNLLRVDRPKGATVDALAAEAERLHGERGHSHRRVSVLDESAGERLAAGFAALDWQVEHLVFMAYRGAGQRRTHADVEEVEAGRLRPLREAIALTEPWADSEEVARTVVASGRLFAAAGRARHFAVLVDGEPVSAAELYSDGRTAQVEDVVTLPEHRGRGLASAVVVRAVDEALAAGHDFVFLSTDDDDWPKELYARLGFAPLGRKWAFLRRPAPASPERPQRLP